MSRFAGKNEFKNYRDVNMSVLVNLKLLSRVNKHVNLFLNSRTNRKTIQETLL